MCKRKLANILTITFTVLFICGCANVKSEIQNEIKNDESTEIMMKEKLALENTLEIQKNSQLKFQFTSGMLFCVSATEKEKEDSMKQYGWDISTKFFDNLSSMMLALKSGQIDNIASLPKSTAEYIRKHNNDIIIIKSPGSSKIQYSMGTLEDNKEVFNILNDTLKDIIKDGIIKDIEEKYINEIIEDKSEPKPIDMPYFEGAKTIKVAVTGDLPPFDYVSANGIPSGYNSVLLSEIANRAKVNIQLVNMDEKAKLIALVAKNIDAIFWISNYKFTDERNKVYDCPKGVIMTDYYYEDDAYNVCLKGGKLDKMFGVK